MNNIKTIKQKTSWLNEIGRILPHNEEMEKFVLGSMLMSPSIIAKIRGQLSPEMFYSEVHQKISRHLFEIAGKSTHVDMLTLCDALRNNNELESVGGHYAIAQLTNTVGNPARAITYIPFIRDMYWRRELVIIFSKITDASFNATPMEEIDSMLLAVHHQTTQMISGNTVENYPMKFDTAVVESEKARDKKIDPFITTGYIKLDKLIGGNTKGEMICIAGRASMGKTAFAISTMNSLAMQGINSGLLSLEMASNEIVFRFLSQRTGLTHLNIKSGNYDDDGRKSIMDAMLGIRHNIFINDTYCNVENLRSICIDMVEKHQVKMIFIDYIQLIASVHKINNREQEVSMISRTVKSLAKELQIPIAALSQLSRETEKRPDKRPQLSDLRESGSLEQDSDKVFFLFRPDYYKMLKDDSGNDLTGKAMVTVAKNRNGKLGTATLEFDANTMTFSDEPILNQINQF